MKYRKFGKTDLLVSEIGFGAWAIGGNAVVGKIPIGWGPTDDAVSKQAIFTAIDKGINFFDTADFYGLGHSEKLIGETLANNKEAIIATKVGQREGPDSNIIHDNSKGWIIEACEQSLRRLKRDTIDYYQLHVGKLESLQQGECIEAMQLLQQQGKIRYWGHSLFTWKPKPEADYLIARQLGDGFQLVLNAINLIALPTMQAAAKLDYGIIARMPLQFGLLSGNFKPDKIFGSDDHRSGRLTQNIMQQSMDVLRTEMVPLAKQYNTSLAGLALSFVLAFEEVSTVIPGMRTSEQVIKNVTSKVNLSDADKNYIISLADSKWKPILEMIEMRG